MKYCKTCFYPETKPDLRFNDDGICGACISHDNNTEKNWDKLEQDFIKYLKDNKTHECYDCIVPVSGGKDSTYQVLKVLEYGFNPLCVSAPTDYMTPLGKANLENLINLGVDHIYVSVNPTIRKKINRHSFFSVGDLQWPEHLLINTIPLHIASYFGISVIVRGECAIREYGAGRLEDENLAYYSKRILNEYGGLNGQRISDLEHVLNINKSDTHFYEYPDLEKNKGIKIRPLWLDTYFKWSGIQNLLVAQAHGFKVAQHIIQGTVSNSENLDNYIHGIHDYFKYLKFGFSRATDFSNNLLRRNMITRSQARNMILQHDGRFPSVYMDKKLEDILSMYDISIDQFREVADDYTNYSIFKTDIHDKLKLREDGSPELIDSIPE